jgi:GGDEF domain-containing protein
VSPRRPFRGLESEILAVLDAADEAMSVVRMAGVVAAQRHAAITDGLTGLRSLRCLEQAFRAEAARARRSGYSLNMFC